MTVPNPFASRILPECSCPADCGGRPEAGRPLHPVHPEVRPGGRTPPPVPYLPRTRGELVHDALNNRTGVFMGRIGKAYYLRPERGGAEWEADPRWLQRPDERTSR
ncbi:hypothetical protein ACFW1A_39950 [Kitasatospora sp. NPDC058965]|uniref:hypothetical protein n=1 Tax=Kitasatospora sp. NPDC058965 TaxID=3346682 RepID=UPI0036B86578